MCELMIEEKRKNRVAIVRDSTLPKELSAIGKYGKNADRKIIDRIESMIDRAIRHTIETLPSFPNPKPLIVIKPNLTTEARPEDIVTTDPRIVQALCHFLRKKYRHARICIVDNPSLAEKGFSRTVFRETGIEEAAMAGGASECFIDIDDPKSEHFKTTPRWIDNPLVLERVDVFKVIFDANLLINLAKMKTIVDELVSLGLKNWQGITPFSNQWPDISAVGRQDELVGQQQAFHRADHPQKVVDLHKAVQADLTLIDGLWAMEGQGPWSGEKVKMDMIIAGKDPVAVDATASRCMGIDPMEVSIIRIASMDPTLRSIGAGCVREDEIEVTFVDISESHERVYTGKNSIKKVRKYFKRPCWSPLSIIPNVHVHVGGTCIGCMANIRIGLDTLLEKEKKGEFSFREMGGVHIVAGLDVYVRGPLEGLVYVVGDCAGVKVVEGTRSSLERAKAVLSKNSEIIYCQGCTPVHVIEHMAQVFVEYWKRRR